MSLYTNAMVDHKIQTLWI